MTERIPADFEKAFLILRRTFPWINPAFDVKKFSITKSGFREPLLTVEMAPFATVRFAFSWAFGPKLLVPGAKDIPFDPGDPDDIVGAVSFAVKEMLVCRAATDPSFHVFQPRNHVRFDTDGESFGVLARPFSVVAVSPSFGSFAILGLESDGKIKVPASGWFMTDPFMMKDTLLRKVPGWKEIPEIKVPRSVADHFRIVMEGEWTP